MNWEAVIGLETHAQLSTRSKIFSGAATAFGAAPNTQASAVDIALPGVLPSMNKGALERAIRFGLAVGGTINRRSVFARKNYFYPDLPKGYQISQYEIPVVQGGEIAILSPTRGEIKVRLTRAHLEEDAGKSLHEDFQGMTGIDLNRAGTPLLEIVSEPDMRSAEEAVAYAKTLHGLVRWIGICDGNMQEGSFRCDANVSVRRAGDTKLGRRCEIKNVNSFRFLQQAIEFEIRRQIELTQDGGTVEQETRLYDPDRDETRAMRTKEDAQDYRYFPDPDLPPLAIDESWIERIKGGLPELPEAKRQRYVSEYALTPVDAVSLTALPAIADTFDATVRAGAQPKLAANWILGEFSGAVNKADIDPAAAPVSGAELGALLARIQDGTISGKIAKDVFEAMWHGEGSADAIIAKRGLKQISDAGAIEKIVTDVLAVNAAAVAEYKAGKEKAFNALVGKVMAATKGKANPAQVNAILKQKLGKAIPGGPIVVACLRRCEFIRTQKGAGDPGRINPALRRSTVVAISVGANSFARDGSPHQRLVAQPVRPRAVLTEALALVEFVVLVAAFDEHPAAFVFRGEHVGGDPIEEPAVVRDDQRAAGEFRKRVLERTQRLHIEIVGWLVEEQHVAALQQRRREMQPTALAARESTDVLLLIGSLEVEAPEVGA